MNHVITILRREIKSYFNTPMAYIFIIVFLGFNAWLFVHFFFLNNIASMRAFFSLLPWVFLFFMPAITMKMWSEEKRSGTIETLMTLPVKDTEVVLGKFLASFLFVAFSLLLTFPIPLMIGLLGVPDWGIVIGGYIGALFLAAVYIAIGLWVSSFTKNQIVSFIIAVLITFVLFIVGEDLVLVTAPAGLVPFFRYISLGSHFQSIARGVIDTRDVVYYIGVIFLFLYFNIKNIESSKWR